jgi:DNA-binding transcriptional ArsR family regulator
LQHGSRQQKNKFDCFPAGWPAGNLKKTEGHGGHDMLQDTIRALSDPVRRKVLELLRGGPKSVGEILSDLDITGATLSHHLKILKQAGLVSDTRQGNSLIYELNTSVMEDVMDWLAGFLGISASDELPDEGQGGKDEG